MHTSQHDGGFPPHLSDLLNEIKTLGVVEKVAGGASFPYLSFLALYSLTPRSNSYNELKPAACLCVASDAASDLAGIWV